MVINTISTLTTLTSKQKERRKISISFCLFINFSLFLFWGDSMPTISGEVYEFVFKIRLYPFPFLKIEEIVRDGTPLGTQTVTVEHILYIPPLPKEPPRELEEWVDHIVFLAGMDRENWKNPLPVAYRTTDPTTAMYIARAVTRYTGGCWVIITQEKEYPWELSKTVIYVWSRGYYHYIGA